MKTTAAACRFCKRPILWGELSSGKKTPLDPDLRRVVLLDAQAEADAEDEGCPTPIMLKLTIHAVDTGEIVRGLEVEEPFPEFHVAGYVPHWSTCPEADQARTEQAQKRQAQKQADAPPWREALAQARAKTCPREGCSAQGPHIVRCTPWVSHWGDVRCSACKTHIQWLRKPPEADKGAWKLYADAEAKYRPCHNLEAYLDARGFRWRHEPRGLVVIGSTDAENFSLSSLTADEKTQIRALVVAVRAAYGWPADKWDWSNTYTPENT